MGQNNDLARNTIILSFGTAFAKGIQFVMIPFVSSWLSTEAYGTFDLLCTYITLLLPVLTLSTGEAVFRFSASSKDINEQADYVTNGFLVTSINLSICLAVIIALGQVGILSSNLLPAFEFLLFTQLYNHYLQAFLRAVKRLPMYAMMNIVSTAVISVCTVLFVYVWNLGLNGLIFGYGIGYLTGDLMVFFRAKVWRYIAPAKISKHVIGKLIKYSLPLIPNDISWWILNVSDRQIITSFIGLAANGIYAIANKIPALCSTIFGMFSVSWQQNMVEQIETKEWPIYANRVFNQTLTVLLTLCSGILSGTFFLFDFIFDAKYRSGVAYIPILLTAVIFSSIMQFLGGIQIALKKTGENGLTTVMGAIINLIVDLALIRVAGLYAAAISTLVANFTTAFVRQYRLREQVTFHLDKRSNVLLLIYAYFIATIYLFKGHLGLQWVNVLLACIVFLHANSQIIKRFVGKGGGKENERQKENAGRKG